MKDDLIFLDPLSPFLLYLHPLQDKNFSVIF